MAPEERPAFAWGDQRPWRHVRQMAESWRLACGDQELQVPVVAAAACAPVIIVL